jgi:hypothetical protein
LIKLLSPGAFDFDARHYITGARGASVACFIEDVAAQVMERSGGGQGLTFVQFSAQLEPCLTQEDTLHNLNTP